MTRGTVYGGELATVAEPTSMLLPGHDVPLGRYTTVRRLLPQRTRRMVGAWCFVDQFGPEDVAGRPGMRVPPHPHMGLQTVTWLVDGEILHRDSLGSVQTILPGQVNLMTSGHGIAHSEESPPEHPPLMHGLQLWIALPDSARHCAPGFHHYPTVPVVEADGLKATVVAGSFLGVTSPVTVYTPLVGADIRITRSEGARLELEATFEYAALVLSGAATIDDTALEPGSLLYLPPGRTSLPVTGHPGTRLFLLGGEPFDEPLVMWWNFVGRSHEEIAEAREGWETGRRFGTVTGYPGDPLPAPAMPMVRLKARDRHGRTFPA